MIDLDQPLQLSRRLVRPDGAPDGMVEHAVLRTRAQVSSDEWRLLQHFCDPIAPSVLFGAEAPAASAVLEHFVELGFLVPPPEQEFLHDHGLPFLEANRKLFEEPLIGFFGAVQPPADADFIFAGVPFDRAATKSGSAEAPGALRSISGQLPLHTCPQTKRSLGIIDHSAGLTRLAGAALCDLGDINFFYWEGLTECHDRIAAAASEVSAHRAVPVFIGGDHSITEPLVRGLVKEPVFLVQFDAHRDLEVVARQIAHHHGSFLERLRRSDQISGVLQLGIRDFSPAWAAETEKVKYAGARLLRQMSPEQVLSLIPQDARCYVTIDIDVLDHSEAPGTGTPLPGGLRLWQVEDLLEEIGLQREVCALDLVEVAPQFDPTGMTNLAALRLLITFLDAIHRRRRSR